MSLTTLLSTQVYKVVLHDAIPIASKDALGSDLMSFVGNDTDSDSLPDGWEVENGLNGSDHSDASIDADDDGLMNFQEFLHGMKPHSNDTDSDGIPDAWEVENGLNGSDHSDASIDTDADGLTNLQEYQYDTNPHSNDTDSDSMSDGWEAENGLNGKDSSDQ